MRRSAARSPALERSQKPPTLGGGVNRRRNTEKGNGNWPKDYFGQSEIVAQFWWLPLLLIGVLSGWLIPISCSAQASSPIVIVYASQDQVYAEPILHEFTRQTGIKVRAVFDSEAVKTVGLANRLLAERSHPRGDVFWNNEELRTRQLAAQEVFRETNAWATIGFRSRRLVINTNKLARAAAPRRLAELTNETWRGKVALAYPLFGTTTTHFHGLRQHWGDAGWRAWCRALAANRPFLVEGNSVAAKLVARGEAWIGLTDSDDIAAEQRAGAPLVALPLAEESLLIPNTVAVVRAAPHPVAAQQLFEYLQSRPVLDRLLAAQALEGGAATDITTRTLELDWPALLRDLEATTARLQEYFLR